MKCLEKCREHKTSCPNTSCRLWIDYDTEYNCVLETIDKCIDIENRPLTLQEVGERLKLSFVRIKQIETEAMKKLAKLLE